MWWFNSHCHPERSEGSWLSPIARRSLAALGMTSFVFLTACGFQPLYGGGPESSVSAHYADINIPSIPDRDGQYLRNALIDRLYTHGRPSDPKIDLKIDPLKTTLTDLGIQKDATVTRTQIEILAHMQLIDKITGKTLLDRHVRAVGGYDVLDQQYTTVVTRQNVTDHVLDDLSTNIVTELDLYFRRAGDDKETLSKPATPTDANPADTAVTQGVDSPITQGAPALPNPPPPAP